MSQERFVTSTEAIPLSSDKWFPRPGFTQVDTPRFTVSTHIWNYSVATLSVSDRYGMSYLVNPISLNNVNRHLKESGKKIQPGFYFTVEYRQLVDRRSHRVEETKFDSRCVLNQSNLNPILRNLRDNFELFCDRNGDTWEIHYVDFFVSEDVTLHAQDCVYLQNLDLLISTKCTTDMLPHLFSEEGSMLRAEYHPTSTPLPSGGLQIVHIDNARKHPTYFVNLGGLVTEIPSVSDFNLQSGFYIYQCKTEKDSFGKSLRADPEVWYYTFDEMMEGKSKLRLWLTMAEAESLGNVDKQREEEMKERERQWAKEKLEMEKAEAKRKAELAEEEARRKVEMNSEEAKLQQLKHRMEQDAAERKAEMQAREAQWAKEKFEMEQAEAKRKAEMAEREAKLKQEKIEAERQLVDLKSQLAKVEADYKAKQAALDAEREKLKAKLDKESAERKDYYESRSSSRKDSSEGWMTALKVGATVVAVGVGLFKLFG